jgi:outer membrane protein assembly factor BamB
MKLDWYSPLISVSRNGKITRGWVKNDVIILETDRNVLICVDRHLGTERWRLEMEEPMRYEPAVSRHNVIVNIKNVLVAIEKQTGDVRWRIMPNFLMSNAPICFDPGKYPQAYGKNWISLERIYVFDWQAKFRAINVQARDVVYVPGTESRPALAAPEFDLWPAWHITHTSGAVYLDRPFIVHEGMMYYVTDEDRQVHAINEQKEATRPYQLNGRATSMITVNATNLYVAADNYYVYALDRLSLSKKWAYAPGALGVGHIYADEPVANTYVYVPIEHDGIHALKVIRATGGQGGQIEVPESHELVWKLSSFTGTVGASEEHVYLGRDKTEGFAGFHTVAAVKKETGKIVWESALEGISFVLEHHNSWRNEDDKLRLYAVTQDNRIVALKEPTEKVEAVVVRPVAEESNKPKIPGMTRADK